MEVVSEESKGPSKESFGLCAPVLCRRESSFKKMCKAVLFLMKILATAYVQQFLQNYAVIVNCRNY